MVKNIVVAQELLKTVSEEIGWENTSVLQTIKGKELEYIVATHPFIIVIHLSC